MGIAMIFGARIPFFGQGPVSGIWLAFIGWFLSSAAERSYGAMLVHDVLEGVRVSALMRRSGWAVPADYSLGVVKFRIVLKTNDGRFGNYEQPAVEGAQLTVVPRT